MIRFALRAAAAAVVLAGGTTAVADEPACQITFRVGADVTLSALVVYPDYSDALGEFKGESTMVECQPIDEFLVELDDDDELRVLGITMGEDLIDGPIDILRCTWLPVTRFPVAGDFDLSNQAGVAIPHIGFPDVHISNIECTGTIETTTTTTTTTMTTTSTTTLPPAVCGDYDGNGTVSIADALGVLRTSVGLAECEVCVCDADGNGSNQIGDALRTLRLSVGQEVTMSCGPCP